MAMDIQREGAGRRKWIRRILFLGIAAVTIPAITIALARLSLGTLVAEEILFVPAVTDGRVERIHHRPGAPVNPGTVLLSLTNPELQLATTEAEFAVKGAEAKYIDLRVQLNSQMLTQQAEVARIESEHQQAKLQADRDEALFKQALTAELTAKLSRAKADELVKRLDIEKQRLGIKKESNDAQLAVQRAEIDKLKALHELKRSQIEALQVRAGAAGVLQELPVEVGQRVPAGTILAKVAQPTRLKAELKVAETQAKDVTVGLIAEIDTRNGIIPGRVSRIDPAAKEGTVVVDIRLEGALPNGARPDLSVDGTIEIERLADVVFVGRPAFGQPHSTVSMFKLDQDGKGATRVQVKLGRSSVSTIEVVEGLRVGEKVVLSDMSAWDAHDRIRIN